MRPYLSTSASFLLSIHSLGMTPAISPDDIRSSFAYRVRLPLTAICLLTGLTLTVLSEPRFPAESEHHWLFTVTGFILLTAGVLLRVWAAASIGGRKSEELVARGPYSLTRNPLYLGTFLIICGFLSLWHSATLLLMSIPPIFIYIWWVVPAEERVLAFRHGQRFDEYSRQVPRWFPNIRGYVREPFPAIRTRSFSREVQSSLWWIGFALLSHFLCDLRAEPWWTEPLRLP